MQGNRLRAVRLLRTQMLKPRAVICLILLLSCSSSAQEIQQIQSCPDSVGKKKFLGERLRLSLPKGALIKKAQDHDYAEYYVGFGKGNGSVWMNGIYGPNATGGRPDAKLLETEVISNRASHVDGISLVDVKGRKADGSFWRFLGIYGERIHYTDVPKEAAEYFDKIMDDVCYLSWDRMVKKKSS